MIWFPGVFSCNEGETPRIRFASTAPMIQIDLRLDSRGDAPASGDAWPRGKCQWKTKLKKPSKDWTVLYTIPNLHVVWSIIWIEGYQKAKWSLKVRMLWIKSLFFQRIPTETASLRVSPDGFDDPGFGVSGPGNLSFFGEWWWLLDNDHPFNPWKHVFFLGGGETWQPTKMPLGLGFFKGFCWQLYYLLSFCGEDELVDRLLFFFWKYHFIQRGDVMFLCFGFGVLDA